MDTTVKMQDAFSYNIWPIVGILLTIIIVVSFFLISMFMKKQNNKKPVIEDVKVNIDIFAIKYKYLAKLDEIEGRLSTGNLDVRGTYQEMSSAVRDFVYEVTGIKVINYTLLEITQLNMPMLEELMRDYYAPEFAFDTVEDGFEAINKTKRTIEGWV